MLAFLLVALSAGLGALIVFIVARKVFRHDAKTAVVIAVFSFALGFTLGLLI